MACLVANPASASIVQDDVADAEIDNVFDRGCEDDRGVDRCDGDIQANMLDLYGWMSAQELVEQGIQFRRFMMVDGYGRDVLALAFERRPGRSPVVQVWVPKPQYAEGETEDPPETPLTATLSAAQWQRALELTELFDEKLAKEEAKKDPNDKTLTICLHSWFTVIEAGEPPRIRNGKTSPAKIRSDAEDACTKGLAMPASFDLADLAFEALAECHGLDLDKYRNRIMQLAHCKRLGGDRIAATAVAEMIRDLEEQLERADEGAFQRFFEWENRAEGKVFAGRLADALVYWGAPHAKDQFNAVVLGTMTPDDQPEGDNTYRYADIRLELTSNGSSWKIGTYSISDIKTATVGY